MNILIVSQYYYPEQFQINEIAPELVKRGHKVTVLTGLPNYPKGEIYQEYVDAPQKMDETINGVRIIRVRNQPRKKGVLNLIRNYCSYAHLASKKAKTFEEKFDIVYCYETSPVTAIFPAAAYAKKHKVPLICYCLDIWPESAKAHVDIPGVYWMITRLSAYLYRKCDRIDVTSRPFIEYLSTVDHYPVNRLFYLPQHASAEMLSEHMEAKENGVADFMYAGNMGKGQTLDVIIRAVAEIPRDRKFLVHMVGDGTCRKDLEDLAASLGVSEKFVFYGNQRRETMPDMYRKADALLLTLRGNNFVGNTMPGKLQMYMTTGKPIFGAINGAANEVINEAGCGECTSAGDSKGLAELMMRYMDNPNKYQDCGQKARKYFTEHFTLNIFMNQLEKTLKETADKGVRI